jgi:long-chain fatty acid transport protein
MNVKYDAEMKGFTWPREVEFGIAAHVTPQLLVATDIKWLDWSSAMNVVSMRANNPDIPVTFNDLDLQFDMNWEDQWVFAIGAEYTLLPEQALRCGYNYGKSPVPDANLTPLFPGIVEHHLTLGYGVVTRQWGFDFGWEHAFEHSQTNPDPLVPGPTVQHSQDTFHAVMTWYF